MNIEIGQIFTQIISFLIMVWVLKRYAWKPLIKIMDDRREKIQADFNLIEEQKKENERLHQDYEDKLNEIHIEAKKMIKEANEKGREITLRIENEANEHAKIIIAQAREDLQNEIVKAKHQLKNEIVQMTLQATQKIIEKNLDKETQKKFFDEFVEQSELI